MRHWGLIAILFGSLSAAAAAVPGTLSIGGAGPASWMQVVASPNNDWINDLVPLANGNLLAVGFVNREAANDPPSDWVAVAVELMPDGKRVAERRYGEGGGVDAFWSVREDSGGRRMFAGFTTRIGHGGIDALALAANADGSLVGETAFGGGGYDRFTDIAVAADGFAFLGHSQLPESDLRRAYLVRTDRDGAKLWERIFDGPESWRALYVEPSGDGGFFIAGGVSAAGGDGDMFLLKTDGEGRELWRNRVGTPDWDEINHGLVVRPDGTVVLVGYTHAHGSETNDLVAVTLDREGEIVRLERFGGPGDDRAILPKLAGDGRIWIVGQTASAGAGGADLLLTALDAEGAFTGQAVTVGGKLDDHGTAVLPMSDGSIIVAGYSENLGRGGEDAFIMRLAEPNQQASTELSRMVVRPAR